MLDTDLTRLDGELHGQFGIGVGEFKVSAVSAGVGIGTKSAGSVSTYRSRYFTEQKRKTFKEFSLTTTAGLLNSSLTRGNVAERAADQRSNGLKTGIATTDLALVPVEPVDPSDALQVGPQLRRRPYGLFQDRCGPADRKGSDQGTGNVQENQFVD
ncbi:hypothetical protein FIV00_25895 [Labrenzia sp. THAF82]|nr:hypothetical protein FIV00_25895 [Labrenzia sp. THAF82]